MAKAVHQAHVQSHADSKASRLQGRDAGGGLCREIMAAKSKTRSATIVRYGAVWDGRIHPAQIELACIKRLGSWIDPKNGRRCGNGLAFHMTEFLKLAWPTMDFHRWTELEIEEFCRGGRLGVFGPSSSGKSFVFTRCALTLFYACPGTSESDADDGTTVIISSTTLPALHRRIWDYVVSSHRAAKRVMPFLPGHLIESRTMLLADEAATEGRSYKNGIIGVACKKGGKWQGLEEYVGIKNKVFVLIADECYAMPMGFLDALANLESNGTIFTAMLGNLPDLDNPLAAACEPKQGWSSLPATKISRAYDTRWFNGRAIQLIGEDSPNFDYPEGEEPFTKLIGRRYIEQCAYNYGRGTLKFCMFAEGAIPDATMSATVFTKYDAIKHNVLDGVTWSHEPVVRGYAMDIAYSGVGGDRTPGAPFTFGKDNTGRWKLMLGPIKIYMGSKDPKKSHVEAIAEEVRRDCEGLGIPPEHFFYDGTGRSEFTIAIARCWSAQVNSIEFGGKATDRPTFTGEKHLHGEKQGEIKLCDECFDKFVSELWFAWASCITSDQMRGLTDEVLDEGARRRWELVRGARQSVETKSDMKDRGLRSPDLSDMCVTAVEGARRLGFPLGKHTPPKKRTGSNWLEAMREQSWEDATKDELKVA
jgi:hypothetical protein